MAKVSTPTSQNEKEVAAFVQAVLKENKPVNVDNRFGPQCWDLAALYSMSVVDMSIMNPLPTLGKGAYGVYDRFGEPLSKYYRKIAFKPGRKPQVGDLIVWNTRLPADIHNGHIAIVLEVLTDGFISFDQNWDGIMKPKKVRHTYQGIAGWLRPKKFDTAYTEKAKEELMLVGMTKVAPGANSSLSLIARDVFNYPDWYQESAWKRVLKYNSHLATGNYNVIAPNQPIYGPKPKVKVIAGVASSPVAVTPSPASPIPEVSHYEIVQPENPIYETPMPQPATANPIKLWQNFAEAVSPTDTARGFIKYNIPNIAITLIGLVGTYQFVLQDYFKSINVNPSILVAVGIVVSLCGNLGQILIGLGYDRNKDGKIDFNDLKRTNNG